MACAYDIDGSLEEHAGDPKKQSLLASTDNDSRTYYVHQPDEDRSIPRDEWFVSSIDCDNTPYSIRQNSTAPPEEESQNPFVKVKDSSRVPTDTNQIPSSLRAVRDIIVKPYDFVFKMVALAPVYPQADTPCHKAVNILHPLVVMLIITFSYIIQIDGCFHYSKDTWEHKCNHSSENPTDSTPTSAPVTDTHSYTTQGPGYTTQEPGLGGNICATTMVESFLVLGLLHTIAYCYAYYSKHYAEIEHFNSLLETVFIFMKEPYMDLTAERRLVQFSRRLLYGGALWFVVCLVGDSMFLFSRFEYLYIPRICTPQERIALCCGMLVSFTLLNAVYLIVVLWYVLQCRFTSLYIKCLIKRIREDTIRLFEALEKCDDIRKLVEKLNHNAGASVSIMLINFAAIVIIYTLIVINADKAPEKGTPFVLGLLSTIVSIGLSVILMAVILCEAASLSRKCRKLRKMGAEVRKRTPREYEFEPPQDSAASPASSADYSGAPDGYRMTNPVANALLDRQLPMKISDFHFAMSDLSFTAQLFKVPVRGGPVFVLCVVAAFVIFLVSQLQNDSAGLYPLRS